MKMKNLECVDLRQSNPQGDNFRIRIIIPSVKIGIPSIDIHNRSLLSLDKRWISNGIAIRDPSGSGSAVTVNGLDASNPLHVQNSDNSNSVIIPFKLLGTENYRIWSGAVKLALQDRNKYGCKIQESGLN
ncbi:ribonuclease H-like domain-containing protein [Tanacetum coccineum]